MSIASLDSLSWIKSELERTLETARRRLDAYAEDSADPGLLEEFIELTHQVAGSFAMVELEAGRVLVEHMETLARAIRDARAESAREDFELLMRASLELSDYLDRLVSGLPDAAAVLLGVTNEIRARLGGDPLERERFARREPAPAPPRPSGEDLVSLAAELRPGYQAALLAFYRGQDRDRALARMTDIAARLEAAATTPGAFEFLWVVGGFMEALAEQASEPDLAARKILGQFERELKRLAGSSEAALADAPPDALITRMLGEIERSPASGERVTAIREAFGLGVQAAPPVQARAISPGSALLASAGGAVLEDLGRVRDRIDIFVRTGSKNATDLAPLDDTLKKIADALGMMGLETAREHVTREREAIRELAGSGAADESALLKLATGLIVVESDVEAFLTGSGEDPRALAERGARVAGLREVLADISRIKEAVGEYLRTADARALAELPRLADVLTRTLDFLLLNAAAAPMARIGAYLERLRTGAEQPEREELDRLADAVVSIEYYLETLQHGREAPASMLENADRALRVLEEASPEEPAPIAPTEFVTPPVPREAMTAFELPPVREAGADPEIVAVFMDEAGEVSETLAKAWPIWQSNPEDREALTIIRRAFHTLKGSGRMVGARRLGEFSWAYENLLNRVLDYTLPPAEPIIAAAGEAIGAVPGLVAQFGDGPEPAADVGELFDRAWRLVHDEALALGDEAEVDRAAGGSVERGLETAVPDAVAANGDGAVDEATAAGAEPQEVLETIEVERESGAAVEQPPSEESSDESAEEGGASVPDVPPPAPEPQPRLDPVLYGIYRRETEEQLTVLRAWLDTRVPGLPPRVTPELYRAVHTLLGSARMAGVVEMAALYSPLDAALRRLGEDRADPTGLLAESLGEALAMGEAILAAYADAAQPLPDWAPVAERMVAFDAGFDLQSAVEAEATPAEPPGGDEERTAGEPTVVGEGPAAPHVVDLEAEVAYDAELAQIFMAEANELLDGADSAAHAWSGNHDLAAPLAELLRRLHTLKGGARMAGVTPLADLTHALESVLTRVADGTLAVSDTLLRLVERTLDRLHQMLAHVAAGGKIPVDEVIFAELREYSRVAAPDEMPSAGDAMAANIGGGAQDETPAAEAAGGETADETEVPPEAADETQTSEAADQAEAPAELVEEQHAAPQIRHEMARVRADLLESSINNSGEVSIYRGRIEQQLLNMNVHLAELDRTVERLRNQLRELEIETEAQILSNYEQQRPEATEREFDPLEFDRYTRIHELSRSLAEAVSDLASLRSLFATELRQADVLLERQGRVNAELQDALMRTRMVPFALSAPRLRRLVRQVAEESGKQVAFDMIGIEGEMDRQLIGHILPALEHLLRNAVVHGIEAPAERARRGKQANGRITLSLTRDGGDMLIDVADDGGGLDLGAIREKAKEQGLIAADDSLTEAEIVALVYRPGFSTASTVTQAAGRGVGLDVVAAETRQIGGSTEIETTPHKGTRCRLRLPATLAITQVLLVRVGQTRYPVALASIAGVARLARVELDRLLKEDDPRYEYGGESYELVSLAGILAEELPPAEERPVRQPLLLVNTGGRRVALIGEDMEGSREIVVKPVGPQVARIPGLAGATIFGDGSIGLLLDLSSLVRGLPRIESAGEESSRPSEPADERPSEPLVMVVDDSITVRRVTQHLLERNGARVLAAKDGVEALELLQDHRPDALLLDIEMPRMDGYELAGHMKNDERLRTIPIIVITSRTGEKHRARAEQIGITHYLGKPYRDTDLIEAIRSVAPDFSAPASRIPTE